MDIFTFTPGGPETIDAFNSRLAKYAADNNVVGVKPSTLGSTLVLSLTLDKDVPGMFALRPFVAIIPAGPLGGLESDLDRYLQAMKAEDKPEDGIMSVPVEITTHAAVHDETKQQGYALFLITIAELDAEAE